MNKKTFRLEIGLILAKLWKFEVGQIFDLANLQVKYFDHFGMIIIVLYIFFYFFVWKLYICMYLYFLKFYRQFSVDFYILISSSINFFDFHHSPKIHK